jgi:hypothetical protein
MNLSEEKQNEILTKKLGYKVVGNRVNDKQEDNIATATKENEASRNLSLSKGFKDKNGNAYYVHGGQYRVDKGVDKEGKRQHEVVKELDYQIAKNPNYKNDVVQTIQILESKPDKTEEEKKQLEALKNKKASLGF